MRVEIISVVYTLINWWTLQLVVSVSECFSDLYSFRRNTLLEFIITSYIRPFSASCILRTH